MRMRDATVSLKTRLKKFVINRCISKSCIMGIGASNSLTILYRVLEIRHNLLSLEKKR